MYHVQLHFWVRGIDEKIVHTWKGMEPLPRFSHLFHNFSRSLRLPRGRNQIVLLGDVKALQISMLRQDIGSKGKLILCTDHVEELAAEELAYFDDIWPLATLPALAEFRFRRLQEELKREKDAWLTQTYLEQTINTLPDMIWFKDIKGIHLHVNDAFCTAVNKRKADVEGKDHYYIWGIPKEVYERSDYVCVETEEDVLQKRRTCLYDEEVMSAQGLRKLKTYKTPIFAEDSQDIIGTVGIARDVTQEKEYFSTIQRLTREDSLTSLLNREYFYALLERAKRDPYELLVFDIEAFHEFNERHGHSLGDAVLQILAEELRAVFPEDDIARIGGDEFAVLVQGAWPKEEIQAKIKEFQDGLSAMLAMDERLKSVHVTAAVVCAQPGQTSERVLLASSIALHQAKKIGGGACVIETCEAEDGAPSSGEEISGCASPRDSL